MNRLLRRGYVELIGVTSLGLLVLGIAQFLAGRGGDWLVAASPWLLATASVGVSTVHVARRVGATDWAWRTLSLAASLLTLAIGGLLPFVVALGGLVAMVGYQRWYARQHRPSGALAVGASLPDFPLQRSDGTVASSADLRKAPHVVLFYRGAWCPFCVAQVRALAEQYRELDRRGVRIALISPQPAADTQALAARFEVPMDFYVDEGGAAAALLDIVQRGGVPLAFTAGTNGDTVVPTVVITDRAGQVVWLTHSEDHRIRPEPATFLEVIDRAGIGAG